MSQHPIRPDRSSTAGTPRWVKAFGVIILVLALLVVILHLTGNSLGGHGSHTLSSSIIEQGMQQL